MLCVLATGAAGAERMSLTIAETDLSQALLELAHQAGISIVFPKEATVRVRAAGIHGEHTVVSALEQLIGDACLSFSLISEALVAVRDGCDGAAGAPVGSESSADSSMHASGALYAELAAPPGVEEVLVSDVRVTGSRIRVPRIDDTTQADIIERPDIESAGVQAIGELLKFLPSVAGNSTSTLISNGGDGTATVTLRGLPSSNTLVLINGRRTNPDAFTGRSVDLNTVPIGLVERIEVLKDGASAIYGSDAIAGVVNLITRSQPSGLHLETSYGGASRSDLDTANASVTYGGAFDAGNVALHTNLGASYYEQDPIFSRDRKLSRSSDERRFGAGDERSSATAPARVTLPQGPVILASSDLDGSDPTQFRAATEEDLFEYRDFSVSVVPSERWSLFADLTADLTNELTLYLESLFTDTTATNTLASTPLFTGFDYLPYPIAADNPYNPFGIVIQDLRRRLVELAPREEEFESRTRRLVLGVSGTFERIHWDLSVADNRTDSQQRSRHIIDGLRLQRALGPIASCVDDCVPVDLFGPPGSLTPEMVDYIGASTRSTGKSVLRTAAFNFDFPGPTLPAGSVELASGIEYRQERLETDPDVLVAAGHAVGGANFGPTNGSRNVWEAYVEMLLPLIENRPFVDLFDLQLAMRVSKYSDFGNTSNPRVAFRYRPTPSIMLRASYSSGFRAPTLHQLFTSETFSFDSLTDPCALPANVGTLPGCTKLSDPTLAQFPTIKGGDPDLDPERAATRTVGVVFAPVSIPELNASVDFYSISARDVVDSSAQFVVNQNARALTFPNRVSRDVNGNLTRVTATMLNIGERDVSGIDFRITYELPETGIGNFDLALNATHIRSFRDRLDPNSPAREHAGTFTDEASSGNGALPDWKANIGFNWRQHGWQASYAMHFVSRLKEVIPATERHRTIDSWRIHNLQLSYLGPETYWARISIGANNVFDEAPPFSAAAFNDSYDARTYDITGRYLYAQLTKDL